MISRALNSSNDIFKINGRIAISENAAQVLQMVRSNLQFYLGEHFLDNTVGTPWFQNVFIKPVNIALSESSLRSVILNTSGVDSIISFDFDFDRSNRGASVTFEAKTIYDEIISSEVYLNI